MDEPATSWSSRPWCLATRSPATSSKSRVARPACMSATVWRSIPRGGAAIALGACEGRPNLCENIYFMGSASKTPHMQGGFASYFDAIPAQCVGSERTPMAAAALAEPLAVCLHAVGRAGSVEGRRGIVFGAGPIGLLTVLAARLAGVSEIAVVDVAAAPLAFRTSWGGSRRGHFRGRRRSDEPRRGTSLRRRLRGLGNGCRFTSAISNVRRGGTVVQIGNLPGGLIPIPANAVMAREIDLRGSFRFGREFEKAVHLIVVRRIDVLSLVTADVHFPKLRRGSA